MSTAKRRVQKLGTILTPKQAILLWLQESRACTSIEEYFDHVKGEPDDTPPIVRLTSQAVAGVRQTLRGRPQRAIDRAVLDAIKDVLFLFYLHHGVNSKLITGNRYDWARWQLPWLASPPDSGVRRLWPPSDPVSPPSNLVCPGGIPWSPCGRNGTRSGSGCPSSSVA